MPPALDVMLLADQLARVRAKHPQESFDGDPARLRVWHGGVPSRTGDIYTLRYDFGDSFVEGPPSVVFCAAETHVEGDRSAWPAGPDSLFKRPPDHVAGWLCTQTTREGLQHHADWRERSPWTSERPLECIVDTIHELLQRADLQPRSVR